MTRILVLSDTHLDVRTETPGSQMDLCDDLSGYFDEADLILHAGDHTGLEFYRALQRMGHLISVCGNMDTQPLHKELPKNAFIARDGVRIGMIHGWGPPTNLPERVLGTFSNAAPDVIIFGHSHEPYLARCGKVLMLNPGSPTRPRRSFPSVGWLEISQGVANASIVELPRDGMFL